MDDGRKARAGRPRGFDAEEALERALVVFWRQGYEGATLTDLTRAMGITRTSMYAAFGNKEELFRRALDRYSEGPGGYVARALEEPTARAVAAGLLNGAVRATTRPGCPAGCLGVQGALATGDPGHRARDVLIAWRNDAGSRVADRFRRAVAEGDLPPGTDPDRLSRYVTSLVYGISVQAASGVARDDLQQVADTVLRNWPPATGG
ncbi:TetR/AcrR family transcriptional regulator [Nocardiopsis sp. NRRL B-16309]|uniref:TetR/AcrR family transcriptional regulator n=1 Tax=Nocardiopsis sp. NRRL B-16309 TaxID=1519494 RepID=UPI0006ADEA3B|nr:TetR/AcrR family transcriptional regulator [Nocardiopsis sp. NRRL B-16309]KOX16354.1 TetR family transcriptional regulator [Nocardiopsis sp. NRRL B-16309]